MRQVALALKNKQTLRLRYTRLHDEPLIRACLSDVIRQRQQTNQNLLSSNVEANSCACPAGLSSVVYDEDSFEEVCKRCGIVVSSGVDLDGENSISYASVYTDATLQQNTNVPMKSIGATSTYMSSEHGMVDSKGQSLKQKDRGFYNNLKKLNYALLYKERGQQIAKRTIVVFTEKLGIPHSIMVEAFQHYKKISDRKLVMGRSIEGMAVASLFYCCKQAGFPRSFKEFTTLMCKKSEKKHFYKNYSIICRNFLMPERKTKVEVFNSTSSDGGPSEIKPVPSSVSISHAIGTESDTNKVVSVLREIRRLRSILNVKSMRTEVHAIDMYQNLMKSEEAKLFFYGKNPTANAMSLLQIADRMALNETDKIKQKELSLACGISPITLRKRYKELLILLRKINYLNKKTVNKLMRS